MTNDYLSKAKVLIVDDEPANVRLLERILALAGCHHVRCTTDPRQALALFLEVEPDIVLLDLNMPHMNGFSVLEQLKAAIPLEDYLPILILTADITVETKRKALTSGAKDFLTKPLDHAEVILRIQNLIENRFLRLSMQRHNLDLERQVQERTAQLEDTLHELQNTQEQIVKQERLRALGMMAGGIAHDFNNALTMMLGYGELLHPWLEEHGSKREITYLDHIVSAAQDASHVVSRLREFYRPAEDNEIRLPVNLNDVVERVISLTSPKWKGKSRAAGVQIEIISHPAKISPVAGNAAELREVLTNLVFNAVDAMPKGGTITLSTHEDIDGVTVSIADTGMGMTPEERERCLEPFFTTKGEHGTGLGLAVVYGIVQRHKGVIEIISEKNVGTTFSIRFPATAEAEAAAKPEIARLDRTLRVLVVDDQEIICELIAEYLHGDGHTTACAFRGDEALEIFRQGTFDLVISDQAMPAMNGTQLAGAIKLHSPETPVILLTGFGDEMLAVGGHPPGVDMVLGKPISHADLRQAVFQAFTTGKKLASVA
ncbi:MAG: response regulator [Chthoniobacter sp.]|nr:response regulator [Chthoniobacter sp.]